MRRVLLVTILGAVLVLVLAGVALAKFVQCDGGRCEGTNRADVIQGSERSDLILALGGYDILYGLGGVDELRGAGGGDELNGGNAADRYYGGDGGDALFEAFDETGNDVMNGGNGGDYLDGRGGEDVLRGERGSESFGASYPRIWGGEGNDELHGSRGDDHMAGEQGRDRHYGGKHDDLIDAYRGEEEGPDARDFVDCGRGNDRAIVLPNDRVLTNCEDVERLRVISGATAQEETKAAAEEERQRALERFLAEREAKR